MIDMYQTITIEFTGPVATVWLNRPAIHNAFNESMIAEVLHCFRQINAWNQVRAVVLRGSGKSFCAGADLNWMRGVAGYSYEQNLAESLQLSDCFHAIYTCNKPTIAFVHGAAIGGANGLLSACDFAYCDHETVFSLSEVKIGIIPACISPYVIKRVGEYNARELMLSGKRFYGSEAERVGLVNKSLDPEELPAYVQSVIDMLLTSGPKAMEHCKNLIHEVTNNLSLSQALEYTARMIADIRASSEGQEGMAAFLEKRKPNWILNE
ncbi:MAG TPA: enoyl-CoA hydratase/isomerase family protein [Bacteroidales bacterium]|nr:enoyl-CoA hydratase/isomerase family protein [Bacteroidales bacterium]